MAALGGIFDKAELNVGKGKLEEIKQYILDEEDAEREIGMVIFDDELSAKQIRNIEMMKTASRQLLNYGCRAVLVKGGHLEDGNMCDVLQLKDESEPHLFMAQKVESHNTHGTGCTLSSAIATFLALGNSMPEAVKQAKEYVYQGILSGKDVHIGEGHGPLNHFHSPVPMHISDED